MRIVLSCVLCICAITQMHAQSKKATQFKPITAADFQVNSPVVDSNANVVVLMDVGSTEFEGNNSGNFTVIFKQRKRILLRNRNGFDEATVKIPIYNGNNFSTEEKFENFEATTFNLENGQVVPTRLDKSSLFAEKVTRDYGVRKFTFPNLKEGSIIEYQYTVKSPFFVFYNIRPWSFQDVHPTLWSEYQVTIPHMFKYLISRRGYLPYEKDTAWKTFKSYSIIETNSTRSNEVYTLSGDAVSAMWVMKDVPAFKAESYTSSSKNHRNRIDFQLLSIHYSAENVQQVVKSWYETAASLMKDADFGLALNEENNWINEAALTVSGITDEMARARKIYAFVRDNFKCTDHDALWLSQSLKKTFQSKTGNVSDINLLLTAIYRKMGYDAKPVLISTRDHGYPQEGTALLQQFNYVLTRVAIGSEYYLLDGSRDNLGFGKLPEDCYNISGRIVDPEQPVLIPLHADSLVEKKVTNVILVNDEKAYVGGVNTVLGAIESTRLREKLKQKKKDEYLKDLKKLVTSEIELSNLQLDSLNQYDEPVQLSYDIQFKFNDEDVLYFNPMLGNAWTRNPFSAAQRVYPVEMPYRINETYILTMDIPNGYKVDEVPKGARVALNGNEGMFEYIFATTPTKIQFRTRIQLDKATFAPEDYQTLRDFFAFIVKKQEEQIVLKKIKKEGDE